MARFGSLGTQYFDDAGDPLVNGKIYFYESGTNTDKDTFKDVNLSIANANPVLLTAAGRQPNIFFNGTARAILTNSDDVQIEVRDPVGGDIDEGAFSGWNSITIYNESDIVTGSNGLYYKSESNGNQGNDPTSDDGTNWSQVKFIGVWNANTEFLIGDVVQASNNKLYASLIEPNQGNDPIIDDGSNWEILTPESAFLIGDIVLSTDGSNYQPPTWLECNGDLYDGATYPLLLPITPRTAIASAEPATGLTSDGIGMAMDDSEVYLATTRLAAAGVKIYKQSAGVFSELVGEPAVQPAGTQMRGCAISPDGVYLAVCSDTIPRLTIYKRSGDVFTKLPDPATLPGNTSYSCDFSRDGNYLAVGYAGASSVIVYSRSGDTFTSITAPPNLLAGDHNSIRWSNDGLYLAVAGAAAPYFRVWPFNPGTNTFGTELPLTGAPASPTGFTVDFSGSDEYIAVGGSFTGKLKTYTLDKVLDQVDAMDDPPAIANDTFSVRFMRDSTKLYVYDPSAGAADTIKVFKPSSSSNSFDLDGSIENVPFISSGGVAGISSYAGETWFVAGIDGGKNIFIAEEEPSLPNVDVGDNSVKGYIKASE